MCSGPISLAEYRGNGYIVSDIVSDTLPKKKTVAVMNMCTVPLIGFVLFGHNKVPAGFFTLIEPPKYYNMGYKHMHFQLCTTLWIKLHKNGQMTVFPV